MKETNRRLLLVCLCLILLAVSIYFLKDNNKSKDVNTKEKQTQGSQVDISTPDENETLDESVPPDQSTHTSSTDQNETSGSSSPLIDTITPTPDIEEENVLNEVHYTKESLNQLPAETILDINEVEETAMDTYFYYEKISENIFNRIQGKSYGEDCTIPLDDLRYVRVLHYGYDEKTHIGELIVNKAIAKDIVEIFKELYEAKYPIERMVLVDEYNADDNTSMAANNTSSFNYRPVPGSDHLSKHALGLAIDLNPLYNPYVQYNDDETIILPVEGTKYADRNLNNPYYIKENDVLFEAFTKRGFSWGGFWKTEPDYQHFVKKID